MFWTFSNEANWTLSFEHAPADATQETKDAVFITTDRNWEIVC